MMKRFLLLGVVATLVFSLSGCRNTCGERKRLFDRGRDREGPIERLRERRDPDRDECDRCGSPVSRTGYPSLGMPVSNGGIVSGPIGVPGSFPSGMSSGDPRELPLPGQMPNIPSPGVPQDPLAQPLPTGPSSVLPMPSTGPGRAVSK